MVSKNGSASGLGPRGSHHKKSVASVATFHRNRHLTSVHIRKQKKEVQLYQLRRNSQQNSQPRGDLNSTLTTVSSDLQNQCPNSVNESSNIDAVSIIANIAALFLTAHAHPRAVTQEQIKNAATQLRLCLHDDNLEEWAQQVVQSGCLLYISLLLTHPDVEVVCDTIWCVNNLLCSKMASHVYQQPGMLLHLSNLLIASHAKIREQAIWCFGNAAVTMAERNAIWSTPGVHEGLLKNLDDPFDPEFLRTICLCLLNLLSGSPVVENNILKDYIPALVNCLIKCRISAIDLSIQNTILSIFVQLMEAGGELCVQYCVSCELVAPVMQLIEEFSDQPIMKNANEIIGAIAIGSDQLVGLLLTPQWGYLKNCEKLLCHESRKVRKLTMWTLSNIAAGTPEQAQAIMRQKELLLRVMERVNNENHFPARLEATWTAINLAARLPEEELCEFVFERMGVEFIAVIFRTLQRETSLILLTLNVLERIIRVIGEEFVEAFEEIEGVALLEELQEHQNEEIYQKSYVLMEQFMAFNETMTISPFGEFYYVMPTVDEEPEEEANFSFSLPSKQLFPERASCSSLFGSPMNMTMTSFNRSHQSMSPDSYFNASFGAIEEV